jgi:hypothetical protein
MKTGRRPTAGAGRLEEVTVRGAGITAIGGPVGTLELPAPRALRADELLPGDP